MAASTVQLFTGVTVQPDDAGPAVGGVAAPVRAGQAQVVAQEMDQQQPRLDIARVTRSPLTVMVTCMSGLLSLGPAGGGSAQRPRGQLAGQVALVVGRAALVG